MERDDEAIERVLSIHAGYAILSHTWFQITPGEVTYAQWNKGQFHESNAGYQKLLNFCRTAFNRHSLSLGWMDTICINKESSSELDESIRSMYNWYTRAKICIIYLASTRTVMTMPDDPWFTRGWTLQELIAPSVIKFYNRNWEDLAPLSRNDKMNDMALKQIEEATTITSNELNNMRFVTLSRKMQWAASRKVTREEDGSYSLMGIFSVSFSIAYGEGAERAFGRLIAQILHS
ncbi:hypothetical protein BDN70DRAFT_855426, partial [Pholiota conissans]